MSSYQIIGRNDKLVEIQISESEYNNIMTNVKELYKFKNLIFVVFVMIKNLDECISAFENCDDNKFEVKSSHYLELNQKLFNFVSSFYAFDSYLEKNNMRLSGVVSTCYDQNFEYRFLFKIRNCMVHKNMMAVSSIERKIFEDHIEKRFLISLDYLIETGMSDSILTEVKNMGVNEIDCFKCLQEFKIIFNKMVDELFIGLQHKIINSFLFVIKYVKKINKQHSVYLCVNRKPKTDLLKCLNLFVEAFSKYIIVDRGIMDDIEHHIDIYNLFRKINFYYFDEFNVGAKIN